VTPTCRERRADAADEHGARRGAVDHEAADEDVAAGADLVARRHVGQPRAAAEGSASYSSTSITPAPVPLTSAVFGP